MCAAISLLTLFYIAKYVFLCPPFSLILDISRPPLLSGSFCFFLANRFCLFLLYSLKQICYSFDLQISPSFFQPFCLSAWSVSSVSCLHFPSFCSNHYQCNNFFSIPSSFIIFCNCLYTFCSTLFLCCLCGFQKFLIIFLVVQYYFIFLVQCLFFFTLYLEIYLYIFCFCFPFSCHPPTIAYVCFDLLCNFFCSVSLIFFLLFY